MAAARGLISMPEELVGIDRHAEAFEAACVSPKPLEGVPDFAFQPLHVFQRDIQKIRRCRTRGRGRSCCRAFGGSARTSSRASGSFPSLASVTAAAWTFAHSSRRGSMIVGITSRST